MKQDEYIAKMEKLRDRVDPIMNRDCTLLEKELDLENLVSEAYVEGYHISFEEVASALNALPYYGTLPDSERCKMIHADPSFEVFLATIFKEELAHMTKGEQDG